MVTAPATASPQDAASLSGSNPEMSPGQQRLLGLDLLRFLAVTLVVFRHVDVKGDSWCSPVLAFAMRGGWTGVDIFFVLSGFLVSGLLFREYQKNGDVRLGRFLIRRGWKIYPALWFMVAVSVVFWMSGLWHGSKRGLVGEIFFLQNYLGRFWLTTWSLAVEEHFYLLLAGAVFLFFYFNRRKQHGPAGPFSWVPGLFVFIAVACLISRVLRWRHMTTFAASDILFPSDCRMDELMFGVLLSYFWHFSPANRFRENVLRWRWPLLVVGILGLLPAFLWEVEAAPWVSVFGVMLFAFGAGMLILSTLSFSGLEKMAPLRVLGKLGSYSYSAYLWHGPFLVLGIMAFRKYFPVVWKDWVEFLVSFMATWTLGVIAAKLVEVPVLRLRERFVPVHLPKLK